MKGNSKARDKKTAFQLAVESTPDVASAYQRGLQALRRNEVGLITAADPRLIDGSVNIDKAVETLYPDVNRWDYVIGYGNKVCFVEVHPAFTSEVSKMKQKLQWLKIWLKEKAAPIDSMQKLSPGFVWIQTKQVAILPGSKQARELATLGLKPVRGFKLDDMDRDKE